MILEEKKLELFRKNFKEVVIIAMAAVIYGQQKIITAKDAKIDVLRQEQNSDLKVEVKEKSDMAKYWRDAFITTAKYNSYLTAKDTLQ